MATRPLWERIFFELPYAETARLIGYAGTTVAAFWDAAKDLVEKHGRQKVQNAVNDMTRYDKREAKHPRYEFTAETRKWMWGILGPAPDHPDHDFVRYGPVLAFREDIQKWKQDFAAKKQGEAEKAKPPEPSKEPEKPKKKPTKRKAAK